MHLNVGYFEQKPNMIFTMAGLLDNFCDLIDVFMRTMTSISGDAQNCSNPDAVHKVRQQIVEHIDLWLSECQDTTGRSYM